MAASLIQTGIVPFVGCGGDEAGTAFEEQSGQLASQASVNVTFSCGEVDVATGSGAEWSVAGSSKDGRPPTVRTSDGGVELEPASSSAFPFGSSGRESWTVTLPTDPTIDLGVTLNAGEGRLVLGRAHGSRTSA